MPAHKNKVGFRGTPMERFMRKVNKTETCWLWTASRDVRGYGRFSLGPGNATTSNRAAYLLFKGPIADGLETDHLCRNPSCVNPDHLEAVTHKENVLRGDSLTAYNSQKKVCHRGHPLSGENVYIVKTLGKNGRHCIACKEFMRRLKKTEYPGQDYFHRMNPLIRKAEYNFCERPGNKGGWSRRKVGWL